MDGSDLQQAISLLSGLGDRREDALGSRDALLAFVCIDTFTHHWPSRSTPELEELRLRFAFLKEAESSRYLKQRRLILNHLAKQMLMTE